MKRTEESESQQALEAGGEEDEGVQNSETDEGMQNSE